MYDGYDLEGNLDKHIIHNHFKKSTILVTK